MKRTKLDEKFKSDVNNDFKEWDYIGKKLGIRILIVVLVIGILASVGNVAYKKWRVDQNREIFKESVAYNEAAAAFLADRYQEYNAAETTAEKASIMQYVVMRYPNLDTDEIDNSTLKQFYNKCLNGGK